VPEGFRDKLADWGIFSYKVMLFERDHHGEFLPAEAYSANALATFSTHDLPTFAGWRSGHDLAVKAALGLDPGESDMQRSDALRALERRLHHDGIGTSGFLGALELLVRSPARLVAVAVEDLLGVVDQPNVPGTVAEHPNWRRRLPVALEQLAGALDVAGLQRALAARG
jgi:4-alpha-glucanotransferase